MKKQCPLKYLGLAAAVVALSGFARADGGFLAVKGGTFVDAAGREVILHGVNIVDKSKAHGYLSWHGPEEFAKMRDWGFNCIRLVIIWDGVEPEPGTYDDEYLAGVDKRIQWAKENGMYVLLDMHQDLFSAKFGADGAPLWACLDEDKPHVRGGRIWSDTYFSSPALHAAFDNFWANTPGPDGVGIQDHFALAWQHVAERYADEPAVVGYDLFNEPFIGSRVLDALPQMLAAFATAVAKKQGGAAPVIGDLMRQLTNPGAGTDLRKHLEDMEVFTSLVDSDASLFQEFERTELASMYNRVAEAIRKVDRRHLLFVETNLFCNVGVPSGVVPILGPGGNRDPLQAFAPHGYDVFTDTGDVANASPERLELIFDRHAETAERLGSPVLVGEWGALSGAPGTLPAAEMNVRQFEKHLFSETYWSYHRRKGVEDAPYFPAVVRPYPAAVAGALLRCRSDVAGGEFSCAWKEDPSVTAPSRIYLPAEWFPDGYSVDLEPGGDGWSFEPTAAESSSGYLVIPPTGKEVERGLTVKSAKKERIKAFCIDFNWGPAGFARPGMYTSASAQEHFEWYRELGVNTIQTFCVSCPGYAWYDSEVAPVQPGMKGEFLKEIAELGHDAGMRVMGYFCVGANTYWSETHPDLSHPFKSAIAIPFTTEYLDYLCSEIEEALIMTGIDGFMIDWVYNASHFYRDKKYEWLDCEKRMYEELFGEPFPGDGAMDEARINEFNRRATERCWERIRNAAKSVKPDCIIWLSAYDLHHPMLAGSRMLKEIDWLMNEHPDPVYLEAARKAAGAHTRIIQCICGWGDQHDAGKIIDDPRFAGTGLYGFARPDLKTTLPPEDDSGNARNIAAMREAFNAK